VSYRLIIRLDALADIQEAAEWYDDQEHGLGADFSRTVLEAIGQPARKSPEQPSARSPPTRSLAPTAPVPLPDCLSNAG